MLLVEQNAKLTFGLTDRCIVLENGKVVKEGTSAELQSDPAVRQIYLGM
jgi:branched-chain amino acid transport system ATP-binding protein